MQYQISYLLLSYVDFIVYLDVIENLVEYQYESWMSEEQEQKNDGICLQAYSSKYTKVFQAAILHSCEGQKIFKNWKT